MEVSKSIGASRLLEGVLDLRVGRKKEIMVFCPVGDLKQLEDFCRHVKKLGIRKDADFAFIYRKGLPYKKCKLSAIHATEKYPLGTSGSFFAGQLLAYRLGYPLTVVTDLDALLDSRRTFMEMASICRREGKAVSPVSANPENPGVFGASSLNHWTFFPRQAFEKIGFSIPFFLRGGEDYELLWRYKSSGKMLVYRGGCAVHPMNGHTIFHKMLDGKKHYPYVASLLKALLYMKEYHHSASPKFLFWYAYYSYFADVFGDNGLRGTLENCGKFARLQFENGSPAWFRIEDRGRHEKLEGWSVRMLLSTIASPFAMALFGKYCIYRNCVVPKISRAVLFFRAAIALVLVPFRLCEALVKLAVWDNEAGDMRHLDMRAGNADRVESDFEIFVKTGKIQCTRDD